MEVEIKCSTGYKNIQVDNEFLISNFPVIIQNILITIKNFWVYYYKYGAIPLLRPIGLVQQDVIKNLKLQHPRNLQKLTIYFGLVQNM